MFKRKKQPAPPPRAPAPLPPPPPRVVHRRTAPKLTVTECLQQAQGALSKLRTLNPGDLQAFPLLNEIQRLVQQLKDATASLPPADREAWSFQISDLEEEFRELTDVVVSRADAAPRPEPRLSSPAPSTSGAGSRQAAASPLLSPTNSGRVQQAVALFSRQDGFTAGSQQATAQRRAPVYHTTYHHQRPQQQQQQPQQQTTQAQHQYAQPQQQQQQQGMENMLPQAASSVASTPARSDSSFMYLTDEERELLAQKQQALLQKHFQYLAQQREAEFQRSVAQQAEQGPAATLQQQQYHGSTLSQEQQHAGESLQALYHARQQQRMWPPESEYGSARGTPHAGAADPGQSPAWSTSGMRGSTSSGAQAPPASGRGVSEPAGAWAGGGTASAIAAAYGGTHQQGRQPAASTAAQQEGTTGGGGEEEDLFSGLEIVATDEQQSLPPLQLQQQAITPQQTHAQQDQHPAAASIAAGASTAAPVLAPAEQGAAAPPQPVIAYSFRPPGHLVPSHLYAASRADSRADIAGWSQQATDSAQLAEAPPSGSYEAGGHLQRQPPPQQPQQRGPPDQLQLPQGPEPQVAYLPEVLWQEQQQQQQQFHPGSPHQYQQQQQQQQQQRQQHALQLQHEHQVNASAQGYHRTPLAADAGSNAAGLLAPSPPRGVPSRGGALPQASPFAQAAVEATSWAPPASSAFASAASGTGSLSQPIRKEPEHVRVGYGLEGEADGQEQRQRQAAPAGLRLAAGHSAAVQGAVAAVGGTLDSVAAGLHRQHKHQYAAADAGYTQQVGLAMQAAWALPPKQELQQQLSPQGPANRVESSQSEQQQTHLHLHQSLPAMPANGPQSASAACERGAGAAAADLQHPLHPSLYGTQYVQEQQRNVQRQQHVQQCMQQQQQEQYLHLQQQQQYLQQHLQQAVAQQQQQPQIVPPAGDMHAARHQDVRLLEDLRQQPQPQLHPVASPAGVPVPNPSSGTRMGLGASAGAECYAAVLLGRPGPEPHAQQCAAQQTGAQFDTQHDAHPALQAQRQQQHQHPQGLLQHDVVQQQCIRAAQLCADQPAQQQQQRPLQPQMIHQTGGAPLPAGESIAGSSLRSEQSYNAAGGALAAASPSDYYNSTSDGVAAAGLARLPLNRISSTQSAGASAPAAAPMAATATVAILMNGAHGSESVLDGGGSAAVSVSVAAAAPGGSSGAAAAPTGQPSPYILAVLQRGQNSREDGNLSTAHQPAAVVTTALPTSSELTPTGAGSAPLRAVGLAATPSPPPHPSRSLSDTTAPASEAYPASAGTAGTFALSLPVSSGAVRLRSRSLVSGGGGAGASSGVNPPADPASSLPVPSSLPALADLEAFLDNITGPVDACRTAAEQRAREMVTGLAAALAAAQKVEASVQQQRRAVKAALAGVMASISQLEADQAAAVEGEDFDTAAALDEQLTQLTHRRTNMDEQLRLLADGLQRAAALRLQVLGRQAEVWSTTGAYLTRLQVGQQQMAATLAAQAEREAQAAAMLHRAAQEALAQRRSALEERRADLQVASSEVAAQVAAATAPAEAERQRRASTRDALKAEVESLRALLTAKEAALAAAEAAVAEAAKVVRQQAAVYDRDVERLDEARRQLEAEAAQVAGHGLALQDSERQAEARAAAVDEHQAQLRQQAESLGSAAAAMAAEADALAARVAAEGRSQEQRERLLAADESAREDLKGLERCISDLSADLSRLAEQRGRLAAERAAVQESLAALQRAVPELEVAKRAAAANKDFREAARLSGELRALSAQADMAATQLARLTAAMSELAAAEGGKFSELEELRAMVHEAQRHAAEAHHRFLVFSLGLSRAALEEAVAGELYEEAGAMQAEVAAEEAEVLVLERTWGFARPPPPQQQQQQQPVASAPEARRRTSLEVTSVAAITAAATGPVPSQSNLYVQRSQPQLQPQLSRQSVSGGLSAQSSRSAVSGPRPSPSGGDGGSIGVPVPRGASPSGSSPSSWHQTLPQQPQPYPQYEGSQEAHVPQLQNGKWAKRGGSRTDGGGEGGGSGYGTPVKVVAAVASSPPPPQPQLSQVPVSPLSYLPPSPPPGAVTSPRGPATTSFLYGNAGLLADPRVVTTGASPVNDSVLAAAAAVYGPSARTTLDGESQADAASPHAPQPPPPAYIPPSPVAAAPPQPQPLRASAADGDSLGVYPAAESNGRALGSGQADAAAAMPTDALPMHRSSSRAAVRVGAAAAADALIAGVLDVDASQHGRLPEAAAAAVPLAPVVSPGAAPADPQQLEGVLQFEDTNHVQQQQQRRDNQLVVSEGQGNSTAHDAPEEGEGASALGGDAGSAAELPQHRPTPASKAVSASDSGETRAAEPVEPLVAADRAGASASLGSS